MELVLEKTIRSAAFDIAVSPDGSRLAICGERKITIFSLPGLYKENTIRVSHTSSMVFLGDNKSMLILTTTGRCIFWNGQILESLGKWQVPRWEEKPVFYAGGNDVFWAGSHGIWKYNVNEGTMLKIFQTPHEPYICRVEDGIVYAVILKYGVQLQHIEILELDFAGTVKRACISRNNIQAALFGEPCWNKNGNIAISTCVSKPLGVYSYCYLIDSVNGEIIFQKCEPHSGSCGDFYAAKDLLVKVGDALAEDVSIFDASNMRMLHRIEKTYLAGTDGVNPPSTVTFLDDGRLLVGTWTKLFVFKIVS